MVFDFEENEKEPAKKRQGKNKTWFFSVFWHLWGEDVSKKKTEQKQNKKSFPKILFFFWGGGFLSLHLIFFFVFLSLFISFFASKRKTKT